jgi:uncharacterized RDD family membrane protein YckC
MYPRTPEETEATNIMLAVLYGALSLAACVVPFMAYMIVFAYGFSDPRYMMLMPLVVLLFFLLSLAVMVAAHYHFAARKCPFAMAGAYRVELASVGRRAAAFIIDSLILVVPIMVLYFSVPIIALTALGGGRSGPGAAGVIFMIMWVLVMMALVLLGPPAYFFLLEWKTGATWGKRLMGVRVIMADGNALTALAAFLRTFLRLVDQYLFFIPALACIAATVKYQRLGDLAALTIVIRDRPPDPAPAGP